MFSKLLNGTKDLKQLFMGGAPHVRHSLHPTPPPVIAPLTPALTPMPMRAGTLAHTCNTYTFPSSHVEVAFRFVLQIDSGTRGTVGRGGAPGWRPAAVLEI